MINKKKVILITEVLPHYRVPLLNLLLDDYDLTVAHSSKILENVNFNQISICFKTTGPFIIARQLPVFSDYDVVILTFNLRIINFKKIIFSKRKYKLLLYGIGVSASYNKFYDQNKNLDWLRKLWINKSDGAIFYESYPLIKYASLGIDPSKLHVAYNTVEASKSFNFKNKKYLSLLFLGSLYKEKKIYDLLEAYKLALGYYADIPRLEIVGNGNEFVNIKKWIGINNLKERILLHGAINDIEEISPIMNRAIACISPGQAGLTVQNCFSFGVPFITTKRAITGGELFSIIDGVNGFFYDGSVIGLSNLLVRLFENQSLVIECSNNAYEFYHRFRNTRIWAEAFKKAIAL